MTGAVLRPVKFRPLWAGEGEGKWHDPFSTYFARRGENRAHRGNYSIHVPRYIGQTPPLPWANSFNFCPIPSRDTIPLYLHSPRFYLFIDISLPSSLPTLFVFPVVHRIFAHWSRWWVERKCIVSFCATLDRTYAFYAKRNCVIVELMFNFIKEFISRSDMIPDNGILFFVILTIRILREEILMG